MSSAVTIDYNALKSDPASLEADFKAAFGNGNDALGAIIIKGQSRCWFVMKVYLSLMRTKRASPRICRTAS
jgi:hypothetical protein